jgi:hypothetical protein
MHNVELSFKALNDLNLRNFSAWLVKNNITDEDWEFTSTRDYTTPVKDNNVLHFVRIDDAVAFRITFGI